MGQVFARVGMDVARLSFGFRTALVAWLALCLAWLVGLEHPQWSAMTVWAVSQPLRGHLIEKSAARLVGTVVGALFGLGLVIVSRGEPLILVLGISLWIGLCALLGNLVRGYASYAAMLSGYSAAMVALLDTAHPEHVLALGLDRIVTVALGVVAALITGLLFAAPGDDSTVIEKVQLLTGRVLADIDARLKGQQVSEDEQRSIYGPRGNRGCAGSAWRRLAEGAPHSPKDPRAAGRAGYGDSLVAFACGPGRQPSQ